jgi:phage gp36-like protein
MTAYCTKPDMLARFDPRTLVQLTDRPADDTVPPATTITDAVLDQAIADASNMIDSYIAVVQPLPLPSIPPALVKVACDLVLAALYRDAVPEHVAKAASAAIGWLKDVRENKVRLFPDDRPTEGTGAGLVETAGPEREFTAKTLRGAF